MNCDRAQLLVSMLLDEEAAAVSRDALEAHLRACEACRRFADVSVRVADGYRDEVGCRIDALRRLERSRRRARPVLAAGLLLAALLGGLLAERPTRETTPATAPTLAAVPFQPPVSLLKRPVLIFEEAALPLTLDSERTIATAVDGDAPLSEWMHALPARLAEDLPAPILPPLPTLFAEGT